MAATLDPNTAGRMTCAGPFAVISGDLVRLHIGAPGRMVACAARAPDAGWGGWVTEAGDLRAGDTAARIRRACASACRLTCVFAPGFEAAVPSGGLNIRLPGAAG
jgi:hypothetical protein